MTNIDKFTLDLIKSEIKEIFAKSDSQINARLNAKYVEGLKDMRAYLYRKVIDKLNSHSPIPKGQCECDGCIHNCTTICDFQHYCKKMYKEHDIDTDVRLASDHPEKRWVKAKYTLNEYTITDASDTYECPVCYGSTDTPGDVCPHCNTPLYKEN